MSVMYPHILTSVEYRRKVALECAAAIFASQKWDVSVRPSTQTVSMAKIFFNFLSGVDENDN